VDGAAGRDDSGGGEGC